MRYIDPVTNTALPELEHILELKPLEERRWPELRLDARRAGLVCEGEESGGGDGGDAGDKGGDGAKGDAGGKGGDGDAGDGDDDPAAAATARAEKAEKAAAAKDKELRELKRSNEDAERKEREAGGKFEDLYRAELDKVKERDGTIAELEAEVEKLKDDAKLDGSRGLAREALRQANAHNVERAIVHLDLSKITSESTAKREVGKLKDSDKYLFADGSSRQVRDGGERDRDSGGDDGDKPPRGPARIRKALKDKETAGQS